MFVVKIFPTCREESDEHVGWTSSPDMFGVKLRFKVNPCFNVGKICIQHVQRPLLAYIELPLHVWWKCLSNVFTEDVRDFYHTPTGSVNMFTQHGDTKHVRRGLATLDKYWTLRFFKIHFWYNLRFISRLFLKMSHLTSTDLKLSWKWIF